jgi:hypothetical protein
MVCLTTEMQTLQTSHVYLLSIVPTLPLLPIKKQMCAHGIMPYNWVKSRSAFWCIGSWSYPILVDIQKSMWTTLPSSLIWL